MKINRRKFLFLGLFSIPIIFISNSLIKKKISNNLNHLDLFLSNYEDIDSINFRTNKSQNNYYFENELNQMLLNIGIKNTINTIDKKIKLEFKEGKLKLIDGWILSNTEYEILNLKNKNVQRF